MEAKAMLLLFVVMFFFSEVPLSSSFQWDGKPNDPLIVVIGKNSNNVEFKWRFSPGEKSNWYFVTISRTKNDELNSETTIFVYVSLSGRQTPPSDNRFDLTVDVSGITTVSFVIKDITNQGKNGDKEVGSPVNVMSASETYSYKCQVTFPSGDKDANSVKLNVFKAPVITTKPKDVMLTGWYSKVEFTCEADGKPEPEILWKKIGSSKIFKSGKTLTLSSVTSADYIGVYQCTAKNTIADNVTAVASLQQGSCSSGCTSEEIGIQLTDLTYSNVYENPNSKEYQQLKHDIETQCLNEYPSKEVFKCQLKKFRSGSVVAVIALSYPSSSSTAPLKSAISDGKFAGHVVNPAFVSPTSAPTEKPLTTLSTKPTDEPNKKKRVSTDAPGGVLSKAAIIAIAVVFSIIFIVVIIVLIVCILQKRKKSDPGKPYNKADGRAKPDERAPPSTPLKAQSYDDQYNKPKEVVYADLNFQDRYPNGEGPPPQYTPSSYAEIRPTDQDGQDGRPDESQVEWDKSVKDEMWI